MIFVTSSNSVGYKAIPQNSPTKSMYIKFNVIVSKNLFIHISR